MLKIERTVGENVVFFIYKTRQEKGCRRAGKRSEGTKKEGGRVRFLRTHNGEIVKGQGALMCGKGRQPGVFRSWTLSGLSDFARGKRVDTVYRGIGIRQSARTHFGDFATAANRGGLGTWERSGQGNQERKERGGKHGERNVFIIKNSKRVKIIIKCRLTG